METAVESLGVLVGRARTTPLTRTGIGALANALEDLDAGAALGLALGERDVRAATALALAAGAGRRRVSCEHVALLLPDIDDIGLMAPLVGCCDGDRVTMLLDLVESGRMSWERDATALFLAAVLLDGREVPRRLTALLRLRARSLVSSPAGALLGFAALEIHDPSVDAVAADHVALARLTGVDNAADNLRRVLSQPVLETLPEAEAHVAAGFTVRRPVEKIGRNDPCPCGSGRKYKKCCAAKDAARAADPSPVAGLTMQEYKAQIHLHVDGRDFYSLRPADLAALDFEALTTHQLIATVRRLSNHCRWPDAERAMAVLSARTDLPDGSPDGYREELIDRAYEAKASDVFERQLALIIDPEFIDDRLRLAVAMARPPEPALALLEKMALEGHGHRPDASFDIAFRLLDASPALGILLARGCLRADRELDSETLLEEIERARDRLGLAPNDVAWEMFDVLADAEAERTLGAQATEGAREREKLAREIESLRSQARSAAGQVASLDRRLRARQSELERLSDAPAAPRPEGRPAEAASRTDEERRLRRKAEELSGLISEGHAQRANLRREIARLTEVLRAQAESARSSPGPRADDSEEDEPADPAERPGRLLCPRFARRAEQALESLPHRVAADAVRLAGALGADDELAWSGVGRLRLLERVHSARLGIHHRMLFAVESGALEVLAIVHRKDLESTLERLRSAVRSAGSDHD